ncbi:MAG: Omp28-related outer membrane protein [Bacteroidia bacterium]|nr:Omp28-related outer membrane protein [Bacteroidia bacterium]
MNRKVILVFMCILSALFSEGQPAKRIMLEEFTGTWCGGCPEGTLRSDAIYALYPQECIPLSWHRLDSLTIPEDAALQSRYGINSYPTGLINRYRNINSVYNPIYTLWMTQYTIQRNISAIVTVSFSNMARNGLTYTADVNFEFYTLPEPGIPIKVNVLLTEDSIPAVGILEQTNYSSAIENGNDPLQNWKHNSVVRKAIGGTWGFSGIIPAQVAIGTTYTLPITFNLNTAWNPAYMHAIAYAAYDEDTSLNHTQILNSEIIQLDNFNSTGIYNSDNLNDVSIFPNPLSAGQTVCFSYKLSKSSEIQISITNINGELVSEPFRSYEAAGSHTYLWSDGNAKPRLSKGVYFFQMQLDNGQKVVRQFVIQ